MAAGVYTKVGSGIWMWAPFRRLQRHQEDMVGLCARLLWLALYTTPEAKTSVPGLFLGSINTISEASGIPVDNVRSALDRLLEDDLVDVDLEHRVIRLTSLPDAGESPPNGNTIRGWWRKFQNVPTCPVRDAHVTVLLWIMNEWCRTNSKALSKDHSSAWAETFAILPIPVYTPRQKHLQTTLFLPAGTVPPLTLASGSGDLVRKSGYEVNQVSGNGSRTVREPTGDQDPDKDHDQDLRDQSQSGGGSGEGYANGRRVLTSVPHPAFDAYALAETLHQATGGEFPAALDRTQLVALGRAIDASGDVVVHPGGLAALGEYVASLASLRGAVGLGGGISMNLVTSPGWISSAIKRGLDWRAEVALKGKDPT